MRTGTKITRSDVLRGQSWRMAQQDTSRSSRGGSVNQVYQEQQLDEQSRRCGMMPQNSPSRRVISNEHAIVGNQPCELCWIAEICCIMVCEWITTGPEASLHCAACCHSHSTLLCCCCWSQGGVVEYLCPVGPATGSSLGCRCPRSAVQPPGCLGAASGSKVSCAGCCYPSGDSSRLVSDSSCNWHVSWCGG
jgi:hypothetical protein